MGAAICLAWIKFGHKTAVAASVLLGFFLCVAMHVTGTTRVRTGHLHTRSEATGTVCEATVRRDIGPCTMHRCVAIAGLHNSYHSLKIRPPSARAPESSETSGTRIA